MFSGSSSTIKVRILFTGSVLPWGRGPRGDLLPFDGSHSALVEKVFFCQGPVAKMDPDSSRACGGSSPYGGFTTPDAALVPRRLSQQIPSTAVF